ncbi:MAG: hypothetical protein M3N14_02685 [Bacteroidota bacterium]|nr:hypothetical protein [Bacteroidota bacterium]
MEKFKKLTRSEMKSVSGGIGQNQVWLICNVNGSQVQEVSPCSPCPYCSSGTFVRYAYAGDEQRCPCLA